ncbi:MAG: NAD(P)/FAD-dependent oxidoreductase [Proteobacteria bacterium]|nr:NAD(P)/FAD-dependent oxidoreductase [Pseudomonadota bacterium]
MLRLTEIRLPLDHNQEDVKNAIVGALRIKPLDLTGFSIFKRSYDARKKDAILFVYTLDVETTREEAILSNISSFPNVRKSPDQAFEFTIRAKPGLKERPVIIGAGPCGYFAGLALAQMGYRPLILERGKRVKERAADTFGFWKKGDLDPESNVQFGEGGAGAFSDGKLHTQIKDREFVGRKVLAELVKAGAPPEIAYISKPHIGTFKLIGVVENLRRTIESLGGEIRFGARVDDILIKDGRTCGVRLLTGEEILSGHIILAVGHSARDTYYMLHKKGVRLEPKPFSMGLRIEHPQDLINRRRLGNNTGNQLLGAADYKLVHHAKNGRTVYTFCMCPGGKVVAAASEKGCIVTNGMSQYARDDWNANSALVAGVDPRDFPEGPLAGVEFQRKWEQKAFEAGGGDYSAPAQLVGDFLKNRPSTRLGSVIPSYKPGIRLGDLGECLPGYVISAIKEAIPEFDRKIHGFAMADALLTGVETRTSSPLRILRGPRCESVNIKGLFPAGEGAGYAGGILSSAMDGIKVAQEVAKDMSPVG